MYSPHKRPVVHILHASCKLSKMLSLLVNDFQLFDYKEYVLHLMPFYRKIYFDCQLAELPSWPSLGGGGGGHPRYSGSALDYWLTGREIKPALGA